eukprot:GDKJ01035729.1.p1 GENE.GDKJ01035729.1~~GDKJ01035729.1.p1  ORF type:complete len:104 (-),score=8.17 GDKJ01035729.1:104-391(-)
MDQLSLLLQKKVSVVCADGRILLGTLQGIDQYVNLIVNECEERRFSLDGVTSLSMGLQIIRGENVVCVGEVDVITDKSIDFSTIKVNPLKPIKHS